MTLIVSLRIPDGIVIAGDSLSTLVTQNQFNPITDVICPQCQHQHQIQQHFPMPSTPATTLSYTQKVFPFFEQFGVGTFGLGLLLGRSVYFAIRMLEQRLQGSNTYFNGVTQVAETIGNEIYALLSQQLTLEGTSVAALPPDQFLLGFQVVGYDGIEPKTIEVFVGQNVHYNPVGRLGCVYSGSGEMVDAIWNLYQTHPESQPPYYAFSLQDAIDYADFLISTTIAHQRFSQRIPDVGGDTDIALVTPFDGFRWIRQKTISKILEEK